MMQDSLSTQLTVVTPPDSFIPLINDVSILLIGGEPWKEDVINYISEFWRENNIVCYNSTDDSANLAWLYSQTFLADYIIIDIDSNSTLVFLAGALCKNKNVYVYVPDEFDIDRSGLIERILGYSVYQNIEPLILDIRKKVGE